jgi:hypothetical protein
VAEFPAIIPGKSRRDGDWAAAEVLEQALELAPNWAPVLHLEAILGTDPTDTKFNLPFISRSDE